MCTGCSPASWRRVGLMRRRMSQRTWVLAKSASAGEPLQPASRLGVVDKSLCIVVYIELSGTLLPEYLC